jgi:pimeloyl-ACP methyl ester carboxylesterase
MGLNNQRRRLHVSTIDLASITLPCRRILRRSAAGAALLALALLPGVAAAQSLADVQANKQAPLNVVHWGTFYVGGQDVLTDASTTGTVGGVPVLTAGSPGYLTVTQMYVQFMEPDGAAGHTPVVFVHGCCLSSKTWETTPDGRMGWYEYFFRNHYPVYLADQSGRARSGFNASIYNEVRVGEFPPTQLPNILMATHEFSWSVFRFGPTCSTPIPSGTGACVPWPDEKFPLSHVEGLYQQEIPDENATLPAPNPSYANMAALAKELGGAVLVGHSESSSYPTRAALTDPTGVRGIIQLETGCIAPTTATPPGTLTPANIATLAQIPILIVVADHMTAVQPPASCVAMMAAVNGAGGDMTFDLLPALGLHGNSHMMMQDLNNLDVADIIIDWIQDHVDNPKKKKH